VPPRPVGGFVRHHAEVDERAACVANQRAVCPRTVVHGVVVKLVEVGVPVKQRTDIFRDALGRRKFIVRVDVAVVELVEGSRGWSSDPGVGPSHTAMSTLTGAALYLAPAFTNVPRGV